MGRHKGLRRGGRGRAGQRVRMRAEGSAAISQSEASKKRNTRGAAAAAAGMAGHTESLHTATAQHALPQTRGP